MRSETQPTLAPSQRVSTTPRPAADANPVEALDEAFAKSQRGDWRPDEPHGNTRDGADTDLALAVRSQIAALAEQSRELTRLLGRLESRRRD